MSDESYSFSTARARLDEIVTQVRKKDTSLEKSLDLLEEGVRLANACTELIDRADWTVGGADSGEAAEGEVAAEDAVAATDEVTSEPPAPAVGPVADASDDDEMASDDDAFGDAAHEAWADDTPEYRDDEA